VAGPRGAALAIPLVEYCCAGRRSAVLGHRLSEWCGHGPILEEDIATANIALDLMGQAASMFLGSPVRSKGQGA
jgi:ring-1,2-phenylacetyl-CoA epoxidase subunit PaaC